MPHATRDVSTTPEVICENICTTPKAIYEDPSEPFPGAMVPTATKTDAMAHKLWMQELVDKGYVFLGFPSPNPDFEDGEFEATGPPASPEMWSDLNSASPSSSSSSAAASWFTTWPTFSPATSLASPPAAPPVEAPPRGVKRKRCE